MANEEHLAQLQQGVEAWNQWREQHPGIQPDLSNANLRRARLNATNFSNTRLQDVELRLASLCGTDFSFAGLRGADLRDTNLQRAIMTGAALQGAYLINADCREAVFRGANFSHANLVKANLQEADLTGCAVDGISAWDLHLERATQLDVIITPPDEPTITVDNLEVAQFIYLLLHNEKIREVIDATTSKAVLILGRFTPARKAVLDAMRDKLRRRNYLPILFDFEKPASRDLTETISTLAHMARFIIADLTEPSSLPKELEAIVPTLAVPVQPVMEGVARPYALCFRTTGNIPGC